jgi:hypothetical protein
MALIVSPVIVRVRFISVPGAAAIAVLLFAHSWYAYVRHSAGGLVCVIEESAIRRRNTAARPYQIGIGAVARPRLAVAAGLL